MSPRPTRPSDVDPVGWPNALETMLDLRITDRRPISGGDVGRSERVLLSDGTRLFVKVYPNAHDASLSGVAPGETERAGLEWLAQAAALRVARPIAAGHDWIALEWIESAPRARDYEEALGAGLARLHDFGADAVGLEADNVLASLPQSNRTHATWARFYAEERVGALADRASASGLLPPRLVARLAALCEEMERFVGPAERPARLHGDLWSGNVMPDESGAPCLIDPAVYAGHREMDLAMMRLFGGFGRRVFDAYERVSPLVPDWEARVPLHQIWPLLAHVCLFGHSWVAQLEDAVEAVRPAA